MKIDITKIQNPIIRRALEGRARDFMFNYGDNNEERHTDTGHFGGHRDIYETKAEREHNDYSEHDRCYPDSID